MDRDTIALVIGFAMVALPLTLGALAGRALSRSRVRLGRLFYPLLLALNVATAMATFFVLHRLTNVGAWDILSEGALFALALTVASVTSAEAWRRERLFKMGLAALLPLIVLDVAVQLIGVARPVFPPPGDARLVFDFSNRDPPCMSLFPTGESAYFRHDGRPKQGPRVLHVGDSMVFGHGVKSEQAFPALLEGREPGVEHINPSQPGTGPDTNLLIARKWQAQTKADHVVFYFFMGNDLLDLNRAHMCCALGPVLDLSTDPPGALCAEARWKITLETLLTTSPPPYPLRVAAHSSALAGYATQAYPIISTKLQELSRSLRDADRVQAPIEPRYLQVSRIFCALRTSMKEQGANVTVVVLPWRPVLHEKLGKPLANALQRNDVGESVHRTIAELARKEGLDVIDLFDPMLDVLRERGVEPFFNQSYLEDEHFSVEGHQWVAEFLDGELRKRGIKGTTEAATPSEH